MGRTITKATLLAGLLLVSAAVGIASSAVLLAQEEQKGIFGTVAAIARPSPGLTVISLDTTTEGTQEVEAAENTAITIPGRETASSAELSKGDFLAVVAQVSGNRLRAVRILVKPEKPVVHAHVTGSVVGAVGDQVSIMDRHGNVITADPLLQEGGIAPAGEVVTFVVQQDVRAGSLSIVGSESVNQKRERLEAALQTALGSGASENLENLGERARANITGHLTTLREILNRADQSIGFIFSDALDRSVQEYGTVLAAFRLGEPTVKITGVIEDIDRTGGVLFITPGEGPRVDVKLTQATAIQDVFGQGVLPDNLELANQVEAVYELQSKEARSIDVVFPALGQNLVRGLLSQAKRGELEGNASRFDPAAAPPVIAVTLSTNETVSLTITPQTVIRVREESAQLEQLVPGGAVKVRYDPSTLEALEIDTFGEEQTFVSGVVKGFIPKIRPGIRLPGSEAEGNLSVISLDGRAVALNITAETIIERDGIRKNIRAITQGDLVRPTSRYNPGTRNVQRLVLRAPELQGTVRGTGTTPGGRTYVTISTDELDLVTMTVGDATGATRQGAGVAFSDIRVGERVVAGLGSGRRLVASRLELQPPPALRTVGTISSLDSRLFIVTVAPTEGEPLKLLVPNKPGIITKDGNRRASFSDLQEGDQVQLAFHRPNGVVIRLIVTSS